MSDGPVKLQKGTYVTGTGKVFEARKLIKLGRSFTLVIAKGWVDVFASHGWVEVEHTEHSEWIIRSLTEEKLEVVRNVPERSGAPDD